MFLSKKQIVGFSEIHALSEDEPDKVGFPSIHESLGQAEIDDRIISYLKNGFILAGDRGTERDIFDRNEKVLGPFSIYTDWGVGLVSLCRVLLQKI
jgi:hypothetical protein